MRRTGLAGGDEDRLPGIYVLVFALTGQMGISVGRLGSLDFPAGGYAYVGSALRGVGTRIRHHLRPHRHPRWHLDYLLPHGEPAAVIAGHTSEPLECLLAASLNRRFEVFRRFGSSDCRCPGHLFHCERLPLIADAALEALEALGCRPRVLPFSRWPAVV